MFFPRFCCCSPSSTTSEGASMLVLLLLLLNSNWSFSKEVFSSKNVRLAEVVHGPADGPVLWAISASTHGHKSARPPSPTSENRFGLRDSAGSAAIQFGSNLIFTSLNCFAEVVQRENGQSLCISLLSSFHPLWVELSWYPQNCQIDL